MLTSRLARSRLQPVPALAHESVYIGIDIGKQQHVAGFVSNTLLERHQRFEACPAFIFPQSREGFRQFVDRIRALAPLEQCFVLMERTGHYHKALEQYLLELDLPVYLIHVQERPKGLLKTDKRDALSLANQLYNQLEKGIQVADKTQLVRRLVPPTEAARVLKGLTRHRYELIQESTQRKNKLTAICDELFPEFTEVFTNPNLPAALAIRTHFPTPQAVATASIAVLTAVRVGRHPSTAKLAQLQQLAHSSIGTKDLVRQRGLILEQTQLIEELTLLQNHLAQLDTEIQAIVAQAREGQILTSIPGIGPLQAGTILAAIGHIDNFPTAGSLKSYFGWAPTVRQSGSSVNHTQLTPNGNRLMKRMMFLVVWTVIRMDCEWARIYERLVPIKCSYDERTKTYKGKTKVIGRIAGQMIELIYALLKKDAETLRHAAARSKAPAPMLYDPEIHHAHRHGQYRSLKPVQPSATIVCLPPRST